MAISFGCVLDAGAFRGDLQASQAVLRHPESSFCYFDAVGALSGTFPDDAIVQAGIGCTKTADLSQQCSRRH